MLNVAFEFAAGLDDPPPPQAESCVSAMPEPNPRRIRAANSRGAKQSNDRLLWEKLDLGIALFNKLSRFYDAQAQQRCEDEFGSIKMQFYIVFVNLF